MSKQINWKDFEIKGLQPNLIPNGWDSFEPYGSGENYLKNWDFSTEDAWLEHRTKFSYVDGKVVIDFDDNWGGIHQVVGGEEEKVFVLRARVRVTGSEPAIMRLQWGGTQSKLIDISPNGEWVTIEVEMNGREPSRLYVYKARASTNIVEIDWVQLTPKDNQHLVVEKTPLGNGLTRVQTWGGNNAVKYRALNIPMIKDKKYTDSIYIENLRGEFIVSTNTSWNFATIPKGFKGFVSATNTAAVTGTTNFTFKGSKDTSLDFIASEPQIVEGDKANPALIVTDLEDGRSHVQVYGANVDTKLISKPINEFDGELYSLKTEIENLGISLDMVSTVSEEITTINKGDNKVEHIGELEGNQIIVELGAKNG